MSAAEHVPSAGPVASDQASPGTAVYRGACSCGWTAPTVRRATGKGAQATARTEAQRDALEHARKA